MRMTFGKFRGHRLEDIPLAYLHWILDECSAIDVTLRRAVYEETVRRRSPGEDGDDESVEPETSAALVHPGVAAWKQSWRRIIFLAHPDRGGNEELCKLLVAVNQSMREACAS